jgi:lipopolysaccharide transport system ATP-binding protein
MKPVILAERLSKSYRLGQISGGTLSEDLNRWWARLRGQPDPYSKIGQEAHGNQNGNYVWALNNVSFAVEQGEVLGIIGRNGAGKSTLLKILSRVTAPTSGRVKIKGRIASLLEVGTGFHPDLTGRENIFLNGAILGMSRREVQNKFDSIVDFAEVEKFIDTPVKRYSSGMYVRLAFAVAAHLEPEILIVDEVLAVGDAAFQKKCLGKMGEVAHEGRTVLFVSHNMAAIRQLCQKSIVLQTGKISFLGVTSDALANYYSELSSIGFVYNINNSRPSDAPDKARIEKVQFLDAQTLPSKKFLSNDTLLVRLYFKTIRNISNFDISMAIISADGVPIFSETISDETDALNLDAGNYEVDFCFELQYLKLEHYSLTICLSENGQTLDLLNGLPLPDIHNSNLDAFKESRRWGLVRIPVKWSGLRTLRL